MWHPLLKEGQLRHPPRLLRRAGRGCQGARAITGGRELNVWWPAGATSRTGAPAHVPQREEQGTRRIPEGFWGLLESCYNRFYSRVDFPGRSFNKISGITRSYLAACR